MVYGIYSIRDNLVGFMSPVVDVNENTARRNFARAVNQADSALDFSPNDFDLYKLGSFDDQTGVIEPCLPIEFIEHGTNMVGVKYEK